MKKQYKLTLSGFSQKFDNLEEIAAYLRNKYPGALYSYKNSYTKTPLYAEIDILDNILIWKNEGDFLNNRKFGEIKPCYF